VFWVRLLRIERDAFEERGEDALIDRRRERVSARAADEDEAAWVAEMSRTRYVVVRTKHFQELIVGLPMVRMKPRWVYRRRRERQLDATDRHAICGDGRPHPFHQPLQHVPHTAERVGDCIEASGCELFSVAHRPSITLSKAQALTDCPCLGGRGPRTAIRLIWEKAQGTRLCCSSIAHGPRDQGPSSMGLGPRSKTTGPRSTEQHPRLSSRDPKGPHQCPWPIEHAHGRLGQFQRSRFRA